MLSARLGPGLVLARVSSAPDMSPLLQGVIGGGQADDNDQRQCSGREPPGAAGAQTKVHEGPLGSSCDRSDCWLRHQGEWVLVLRAVR